MKKLIFLAVCLLASGMPAFGQTYQELCDRAVTYILFRFPIQPPISVYFGLISYI